MNPGSENRKDLRLHHAATIMVEEYATGSYHYATMHNFSGDGIYFKSDIALRPGAQIRIKFQNQIFKSAPNCYFGEVRWCRESNGNDYSHAYELGIKVTKALKE